jgi:two-component system sensor histidine kinase KdpD
MLAALRTQRLSGPKPGARTAVAASLIAVGLATAAIYPLSEVAPTLSLSVVYLPVVLFVSALWGRWFGLATSLLSAAAFNFFHIPPTGRFNIANGRNWVALIAFTLVAIVASAIADVARSRTEEAERRRAEADLAAALARELLSGADTAKAMGAAARLLSLSVGLPHAAIELGVVKANGRRRLYPLTAGDGEQIATLVVPGNLSPEAEMRLRSDVAPTLAALVAIALRRDALQAEAVQTEALRRSDDVKTALLRAVSHDLRTPLTAIVAAGHALGTDSLSSEERQELSSAVVQEGERLATLVEKLLDLSRLQAGQAVPRRDWLSLEDVLLAAGESLVGPSGMRLSVDPDVPEIRADAVQLERAFANLLENARRYSAPAPVSVHVRHSGDHVVVGVTDQGPGISAAERERIFEPFFRGTQGSQPWPGSGLGLAIAKGFIEANEGEITLQSLPGQGTTFLVTLPVESQLSTVTA